MTRLSTPIFILTAALYACLPQSVAADESQSRRGYASSTLAAKKVELRFARWGDGILIEDVMVNGKGPFRFLLDTGAEGAGRIDTSLVKALKLAPIGSSDSVGVLGQTMEMALYKLDNLALGKLKFSGLQVMGRDYNATIKGPGLRPIHGILGFHLFSEYLLTIDYPARKIDISRGKLPPPDGKNILSIISDDEDPEIEVGLGDQTVKALLDTGAMGELGVPTSVARKLKYTGEPVNRGQQDGVPLQSATLDGVLRLGEAKFEKPTMMIAPRLNQVVVGVRILASLRVTYDQKDARIRIERPAERKRYGMQIGWRNSGLVLKGVDSGSIAEVAGLRSTDRIVAILDRPLAEIDREDLSKLLDASQLTLEIERDGARQQIHMSLK
jgi:predicted aspartyl protease